MKLYTRYFSAFLLLFLLLMYWLNQHLSEYEELCSVEYSKEMIERECRIYREGFAHGSVCKDLCKENTVRVVSCSNSTDTFVVDAVWPDASSVVIKSKKPPFIYNISNTLDDSSLTITEIQQIFHSHVKDHISLRLSHREQVDSLSFRGLLKLLWNIDEDVLQDISTMMSLWSILQQDEYFILQYFHLHHFPTVYGFCGSFYVTGSQEENLEDLLDLPSMEMPWGRRVKIAVSILDFIYELRNNSLIHCDVHPGNFGIVNDIQVIAIDVDSIFSLKRLSTMFIDSPTSCKSDEDCNVINCKAKCDMVSGMCTSKFTNLNNLQFVCQTIFSDEDCIFGRRGLLHDTKGNNAEELESLLIECKSDQLPETDPKTQKLFDKLIHLLYFIAANSEEFLD